VTILLSALAIWFGLSLLLLLFLVVRAAALGRIHLPFSGRLSGHRAEVPEASPEQPSAVEPVVAARYLRGAAAHDDGVGADTVVGQESGERDSSLQTA